MCGIAGGLYLDEKKLRKMTRALRHRGPDAQDCWTGKSFSLGVTRLAKGQQPFRSSCGRITAICNGELYN